MCTELKKKSHVGLILKNLFTSSSSSSSSSWSWSSSYRHRHRHRHRHHHSFDYKFYGYFSLWDMLSCRYSKHQSFSSNYIICCGHKTANQLAVLLTVIAISFKFTSFSLIFINNVISYFHDFWNVYFPVLLLIFSCCRITHDIIP